MVRNKKWWRVGLLAMLAMMLAFALAPTQALAKTGWVKQSNGKYRYYESDSYYYTDGVYQIGKKFYGFDKKGYRQTGWYEQRYDFDDGDSWSYWYYFGKDGAALTGWQKFGGKWYFFEDSSRADGYLWSPSMYANGIYMIGKNYYCFEKSGAWSAGGGWKKITETYGTDSYTYWCYGKSDGTLVTGWKQIGGTWYYFSPYMYNNGLYCLGGSFYYFDKSGAMKTGWQKYSYTIYDDEEKAHTATNWYYLKSNGKAATGWLKDGGKWYYFDSEVTKDTYGDEVYYYGWISMYRDGWYKIGKKQYYFNKGGDMAVGWTQINKNWYYFDSNGSMVKSKWVGNYYLKADGTMAVNEWVDGGKYHVNKNGVYDKKK